LAGALLIVFAAGCDSAGSDTSVVTLSGTVTDGSGDAVENARIEVPATEATIQDEDDPQGTFTARTDSSGNYRLDIEVDASTELTVRAVRGELNNEQIVTVFPGEPRPNVDLVLGSDDGSGGNGGGPVSGASTATITGGVTDVDGRPVRNARVVVSGGATAGDQTYSTPVDSATGAYRLEVQINGSTELTVQAISDNLTAQQTVTVSPEATRQSIDFVLGGGTFTVSGQVTDGDGNPLSDVRVEVPTNDQTVGAETFTARTDGGGNYSLDVEITGSTELTVRAVGDDRTTQQTLTAFPGQTRQNVDLVLGSSTGEGTATVTGTVTDADGNGLNDVRVEVPAGDQTVGSQPFVTLTDAGGQYTLGVDLRSSTEKQIRTVKDTLNAAKTRTLIPGQTRDGIDFVLGGGGSGDDEGGTATVTGRVTNSEGDPVTSARVKVPGNAQTPFSQAISTRTGPNGNYSIDVDLFGSTELTVRATRDQLQAEKTITVFPDETRENVNFILGDTGGGGDGDGDGDDEESGTPTNILLQNVSREVIGIQGSGAPETSRITFQVADSAGRGVSLDNETPVEFTLSGATPGGASIAPQEATTNDNGLVTVNLSTGTTAGTVQIIATAQAKDGDEISSRPVTVTIHGGFPDEEHFSIAPDRHNFQGLFVQGLEMPISVVVGDQYSNPVKPNTSVYFETTGGVVEGSIQTDQQGRGTNQLISADPRPGDGVAQIRARTQNRSGSIVDDTTAVLFSGAGDIRVQKIPSQAFDPVLDMRDPNDVQRLKNALGDTLQFGGYDFAVVDRKGNPLPGGTTVSFTTGGTEVGEGGDVSTEIGDTRFADLNGDGDKLDAEDVVKGQGITQFSGSATADDDPTTSEVPNLESISFSFDAPQSQLTVTITGNASGSQASQAIVSVNGDPVTVVEQGQIVRK
jgi:protocatechuate 3,4-dioxygenase beta subunit